MSAKDFRVGVDVGGTFTKAVAFDIAANAIVAQSIVSTTHTAVAGVAEGVVRCVAEIAQQVGAENISLVTHSTTQAVNALLEGDVGEVGVIGLGRIPELKRARARTQLADVELAPGKMLRTVSMFFDVTAGLDEAAVGEALDRLAERGVASVCVAEAFAPDDASNETRVAEIATSKGLSACASTELSGLYGLELRAVTAAINASILPIAVRTAGFVESGVRAAGIVAPVMVMRGDGGATDLDGFRRAPARTLYSGPAASVAGALRHTAVSDAIVVEIGGTSTNVAAVRFGRPALSYVQVASHATAVRAVDVRVVGVAGGSMLRVATPRWGRPRVHGVGPRSAHIAGLEYAGYADASIFDNATVLLIAPRSGDPADYVVLRSTDGHQYALTNTCAALALGIVQPDDYAFAPGTAAIAAFDRIGAFLGVPGAVVAQQMLQTSGEAVAELVTVLIGAQKLREPTIVAVGGGAGGLGRFSAGLLGMPCDVPAGAEVISSIGDALSLVRVERERTTDAVGATVVAELMAEVQREAIEAGASPATIEVRVEERPELGTVRAIATGSVGLLAGARPGRAPATTDDVSRASARFGGGSVRRIGQFWTVSDGTSVHVFDRFADPAADITGELVDSADALADTVVRLTRHRGPVTLRPSVWVMRGAAFVELSSGDVAVSARDLAAGDSEAVFIVGRTA